MLTISNDAGFSCPAILDGQSERHHTQQKIFYSHVYVAGRVVVVEMENLRKME